MDMRSLRIGICVIAAVCVAADKPRMIVGVNTVTTQVFAPGRYSHFRCDSDGNIYLRVYTGELTSPVVKVSPEGKLLTTFLSDSPSKLVSIQDFWVTSTGEVFVLAEKGGGEGAILVFDADGKSKEEVLLDVPVRPNQLAVFASGDFLVGGREVVVPLEERSVANGSPFLAIFNSRGQLLKRIQLPKDVKPKAKQPLTRADLNYAETVVNSATEISDDGTVYFVRHTRTGPVYAISAGGRVTRTVRLKPPEGAILSTVKVARGTVAAEFVKNGADDGRALSVIIQIIDLKSATKLAEYLSTPPLGPDFACYEPNSFTFIASDQNGHLTITSAAGQ